MYKVIYKDHRTPFYPNLTELTSALRNDFSGRIVDDVEATLECQDRYYGRYFDIEHYVGYIYNDMSFTSLWTLAQTLAKEIDRNTKIEWFIQNVGVCARMDNGDEIDLPWYDMFYNDYDDRTYDGVLAVEVDDSVADEIEKALKEIAPEKGSFVLSFWESDFTIEVEEEDCFDMAVDEDDDYEDEDY